MSIVSWSEQTDRFWPIVRSRGAAAISARRPDLDDHTRGLD